MIDWTGVHAARKDAHHDEDHAARHALGEDDEIDLTGLPGGYSLDDLKTDHPTLSGDELHDPKEHGAAQHTDAIRKIWIPATAGHIIGGTLSERRDHPAVRGDPNAWAPEICLEFYVPPDFVSFSSLKLVWTSFAAAGNMYHSLTAHYGASGEDLLTHQEAPEMDVVATEGADIINVKEPANPLTLVDLAAGDYVGVRAARAGNNALDTLDDYVYFIGLLFEYTAEQ